jgi:mRNA interferase MazF
MYKGDIVLVPLSYQHGESAEVKLVPALVLGVDGSSATIAFITSRTEKQDNCDLILHPKKGNGLKRRSLVKLSKLLTVEKSFIAGRLGTLSTREMVELNLRILQVFELDDFHIASA